MKSTVLIALAALVLCPHLGAYELPTQVETLTNTAVVAQDYLVGYEWKQDATGTLYGPYADLEFKQKLFKDYTAELNLRAFKPASSDDAAQIGFETASVSYVGSWFTFSGGRKDMSTFLGPGEYFGSYLTMGERQLDVATFTLPFRLFADIPDADAEVTAPYNAFSLVYIPNLFEAGKSVAEGNQGLIVSQLRVRFRVGETSSDLSLNYGYGLSDYFINSPVHKGGSFDINYAFKYGIWGWFLDGAVQSLDAATGSSVVAAGSSMDIKRYTYGLLDSALFEAQIPLGGSADNPFTGGDPQNVSLGTLPQWCWFVRVSNKLGAANPTDPLRFFYGGALTTSPGDYTLARLVDGTISTPVGQGYGLGPRVEGLALRSPDYTVYSGIIYAGYEF